VPRQQEGPVTPVQNVRNTLLFSVLRKGREKTLGRSLSEDELSQLEAHAARSASAGVHTAKHRPVDETAKAAVAALPKKLCGQLAPTKLRVSRKANRAHAQRRLGRVVTDIGTLLRMAVKENRIGPQLPAYARKTSALYIQQEDLDDFIPDGWGAEFPSEAGQLGRAVGLPPAAIPLLCLLEWTSSFRPALPFKKDRHECGAGFQVSLDWLARKLGISRVWVQALINRLDPFASWRRERLEVQRANRRRAKRGQEALPEPAKPTGTAYVHRFRRLKRYEDTCPEGARRRIWVDAKGRPHVYVDVRGVVYLTSAGRSVLRQPRRRLEASDDIHDNGFRRRWILAARLRRGHSLVSGGHGTEVIENRRELGSAPDVPSDLSPNHPKLNI
jgi:hypothetical protein